jgi:hypothetical protein
MCFKKIILLICVMLAFTYAGFTQQTTLWNNLQQYGLGYPQEKVYIHFDKPNYLTGDDIWLKAYVTVGPQNQLSAMGQVLYVDLISPSNKVVKNLKLLILHGVSIGDMHLADTLEQGTYHVRAYTNWMRNLPEQTFFNTSFTVGRLMPDPAIIQSTFKYNETAKQLNADITINGQSGFPLANLPVKYELLFDDKTNGSGTAKTDNRGNVVITFNNNNNLNLKTGVLSLTFPVNSKTFQKNIAVNVQQLENKIQFMPEGGNLVTGIQSHVAFKMLQPDGLAASGTGYVEDNTGTKVAEFTAGYAGMGSFYLIPEAGKTYKAIITYGNGKTQTTPLPVALNNGYVLSLYQRSVNTASFGILVSPSLVKNQKVTLLVQRQGKILFVGQKVISAEQSLTKLPLDNYPSGIIQVTLFDDQMQAVCERLFFNFNKQTVLPLATSALNAKYKTRQAVTVSLSAGEITDSLRIGSFSASIINLAGLPSVKTNETGILPGLLLTPELKGYVERPDHYFDEQNTNRTAELDNLILCQGWRRIVWTDIQNAKMPDVNFKPEKGFTVTGTVKQRNGTPVVKSKVTMLSTRVMSAMDTLTDEQGRFVFDRLLLNDTNRFAIRANDPGAKRTVRVKLDELPQLSNLVPYHNITYPEDDGYQNFLKKNYQSLSDLVKTRLAKSNGMLKEVNVEGRIDKKSKVTYSSNLNGPGVADQIFTSEDLETAVSLNKFLEGRALGIVFGGNDTRDWPYTTRGGAAMTIIIDGITQQGNEAPDPSPLTTLSVSDVKSIEILRSNETLAVYGISAGVIIITTKVGEPQNNEAKASPEYVPLMITGYNSIREFYSPDYSVPTKNGDADHRSTIYWKSDIITDKAGNASFKFYTSDDKGTYQLTIQGITSDGRPAQLVKNITVE